MITQVWVAVVLTDSKKAQIGRIWLHFGKGDHGSNPGKVNIFLIV